MENMPEQDCLQQEAGEEQLNALIKQAGDEARLRKRKALERHFKMLRSVVAEGMSRRKESIPT